MWNRCGSFARAAARFHFFLLLQQFFNWVDAFIAGNISGEVSQVIAWAEIISWAVIFVIYAMRCGFHYRAQKKEYETTL